MSGAHHDAEPYFTGAGAVEGGVKAFFLRLRDSGTGLSSSAVFGGRLRSD
jgi:hypothetical protein